MPVPLQTSTITDQVVRTKPATPSLGAAGYQFLDPTFGSTLIRVTDGDTTQVGLNQSFNVNATGSQHGWASDSRKFYVERTDGNFYVAAFDPVALTWSWSGSIGLYNDLTFDQQGTHPNLIYGSLASAPNHHTVGTADVTNLAAPTYSTLFDAATVVNTVLGAGTFPGGDTYLNTIMAQKDKLVVLCGGGSQDHHYFVIWYDFSNPGGSKVLNTLTRPEFQNTSGVTGLHIHSASLDLGARYIVLTPALGDSPQYKEYIWDTTTGTVTPVTISPGGHMESGANGELINQDVYTSAFDSFQYVGRTLAAPDSNLYNVINPVVTPAENYLADHASPNDAVVGQPFVFTSSTYRYNDANGAPYSYVSSPLNTCPWRPFDGEIVRVLATAGQSTTAVRRLCHNRALADSQTQGASGFPNQPLLNVSPDGKWCLFCSNWDGTLGTDSRDGFWRRDVFLVYMALPAAPTFFPPPLQPPYVFGPGWGATRYRFPTSAHMPFVMQPVPGVAPLTAAGIGTAAFVGAATTASVLTAAGSSTYTPTPAQAGALAASGSGTAAFTGHALAAGALTAPASGTATWVGASTASGSGIVAAAGAGAAAFTGAALGSGVLAAAGAGTFTPGVFPQSSGGSSTGSSTVSWVGTANSGNPGTSPVFTFVSRANAVPILLSSPTRYLSATQAHAAGNLLVAVFHMNNGQISTIVNTAGDTWVKSALSPYLPGTIHHHEIWYVLSTKGNPADVVTITVTTQAELVMTVYEFALINPAAQVQYVGDAAANLQVDSGTPPIINSGPIALTLPSVIVSTYRDSLGIPPTSPSGAQFAALNSGGVTSYYDGYQYASAPAAVTAIAGANNTFPQWTILASAFDVVVPPPPPPIMGHGCTTDLPVSTAGGLGIVLEAAGGGTGCVSDLPMAGVAGAGGCLTDLPIPPVTYP